MQYQTLRSVSDNHLFVVCRDGGFYALPEHVRHRGPWQGQHRGNLAHLNTQYLLDIEEQVPKNAGDLLARWKKVKASELTIMTRQLSTMVSSGMSLLRALYVLMFVGVGIPVWGEILNHQGPWDHVRAIAFCVWAAYPTLGLLGLRQPVRMLPLVLFMLWYFAGTLTFVPPVMP